MNWKDRNRTKDNLARDFNKETGMTVMYNNGEYQEWMIDRYINLKEENFKLKHGDKKG